jgi:SAM-dependent methyltransferase
VGCGTGLYLLAQREHFPDAPVGWRGVDASSQMLANAKAKAPDLDLAQARAEALPVGTAAIDYVYTSFAFHHFTDKEAALDEIARILLNGARLRIRNMDPWGQRNWWLYRFFDGTWENDQQRFWPAERIQASLEQRGFEVDIDVEIEHVSRTASDALDEAERRVISQLSILDDASYEAGIARLRTLAPDAEIAYPRAGLHLEAHKH